MKTTDFDFELPDTFIAQNPAVPRDHSKLMIFDTSSGKIFHKHFYDLGEFLIDGDVLVLNRSKVIPARILFEHQGKEREIFVLKKLEGNLWHVLVRPGKIFKLGMKFQIEKECDLTVVEIKDDGSRVVETDFDLITLGQVPLPPYIKSSEADSSQYQTIYAKEKGSVAAPTAGLHFTPELLDGLHKKGVDVEELVLHVGRGTFLPVGSEFLADHIMHSEEFMMPADTAKKLNEALNEHRRIIAVGTTSVRVLESSFKGSFKAGYGDTNIFIYPGNYQWKVVDALITNFHLPKSTLIMLVASFLENKGVKRPVDKILELYEIAKANNYRFYSFGDAMMIL